VSFTRPHKHGKYRVSVVSSSFSFFLHCWFEQMPPPVAEKKARGEKKNAAVSNTNAAGELQKYWKRQKKVKKKQKAKVLQYYAVICLFVD